MKKFEFIVVFLLASLTLSAQSAYNVVVPRPASVEYGAGNITVPDEVGISDGFGVSSGVMDYITSELTSEYGIGVTGSGAPLEIVLGRNDELPAEGYELEFNEISIILSASSESGIFYGFQTFFQMLNACRQYEYHSYTFPCQKICDAPRFPWRAYMLDEARHFMGKDVVLNILDGMAALKMNVFHWHLTDDAGWRIEIKKYPLLTEVGSSRKDTQVGGFQSDMTAGKPHSGFYTQDEIREIMEYARVRQIKVVPEIEMPGHASAAIAAYPWLGIKKEKIEVPVRFGKHYCAFDVIDPKTLEFLHDVLLEVRDLFDADVIHIGGDEVRFNQWEADKDLTAYKKKKGFNSYMDIQIEFTNNIAAFAADHGFKIMGWSEILGKNLHEDDNISFAETSTSIGDNVIVQFWKGDPKEINRAAMDGNKIVNSTSEYTYINFDHDFISLEKAYSFEPVPSDLAPEYQPNIIGLGCQMWTEWANTPQDVYIGTFPRIAAFAETGWSEVSDKDFGSFSERVKLLYPGWRASGLDVYVCE